MAGIMVAALPNTEWQAINNVSVLPDVENNGGKQENAIFTLYNAGILAGSDEYGKVVIDGVEGYMSTWFLKW